MAFQPLLRSWIDTQSDGSLELLLDEIQAQDNYSDHSDVATTVVPLLDAGSYAEARDELLSWMPGLFFSPSTHGLLARAYAGLDETEAAGQEQNFAMISLRLILGSGRGTRDQPWRVLRINDEYDVLAAHGSRAVRQAAFDADGQILDLLETADGRSWWFALRNSGRKDVA